MYTCANFNWANFIRESLLWCIHVYTFTPVIHVCLTVRPSRPTHNKAVLWKHIGKLRNFCSSFVHVFISLLFYLLIYLHFLSFTNSYTYWVFSDRFYEKKCKLIWILWGFFVLLFSIFINAFTSVGILPFIIKHQILRSAYISTLNVFTLLYIDCYSSMFKYR